MRLPARCRAAAMDLFLRLARPRPIDADDLARADFSTHPGGQGLRFTERLRALLRRRWLRRRWLRLRK